MKSKTIERPGYHIRPKYDLRGFREHVNGAAGKKATTFDLPLTSMIDMFMILVIFLLMNFSATGEIFFIQKNMKLPQAVHSKPLETAPLISISSRGVELETRNVGENPVRLTETDQNLPRLAEALRTIRAFEMQVRPGEEFNGAVNIQADEKTPLIYIKRVIQTCLREGWSGINFAVRAADAQSEGEEPGGKRK